MALNLLIPRLEWGEVNFTGTTANGSPIITGISNTDDIKIGMAIKGAGIPADSLVIDKSSSTVTIDMDATTSGSSSLTANYRFDFNYPPSVDGEEDYNVKNIVTKSLSGRRQIQKNYVEVTRDLTFDFLTQDQRTFLQNTFYLAWAFDGNEFKYFYDKADDAYEIYELNDNAFKFDVTRRAKKHPYFLYVLKTSFYRLIDETTSDSLLLESGDNLLTEGGDNIGTEG